MPVFPRLLNFHASATAGLTLFLIFMGGLVKSHEAGLSVPDWPTTYGQNMFLYPPSQWVGGIFYEHTHRLVASGIGLLTLILAIGLWKREPRPWVRRLGYLALASVILQGVLGGMTVWYGLPAPVSVAHGCLAQLFFCMLIGLAVATSPSWISSEPARQGPGSPDLLQLSFLCWATASVVFFQLILGATMRHMEAGLAIPTFPLAFDRWIPPSFNQEIGINFAHRFWALVVSGFILATSFLFWRQPRAGFKLKAIAFSLFLLLAVQILLAAFTVWTGKAPLPTTFHVATGAAILGLCVLLGLRTYQHAFQTH